MVYTPGIKHGNGKSPTWTFSSMIFPWKHIGWGISHCQLLIKGPFPQILLLPLPSEGAANVSVAPGHQKPWTTCPLTLPLKVASIKKQDAKLLLTICCWIIPIYSWIIPACYHPIYISITFYNIYIYNTCNPRMYKSRIALWHVLFFFPVGQDGSNLHTRSIRQLQSRSPSSSKHSLYQLAGFLENMGSLVDAVG